MIEEGAILDLQAELAEAGLAGSFLVRDLSTGAEAAIAAEVEYPIASLAKVPLALAVHQRIHDGRVDPASMIDVQPGTIANGTVGLSRFRHPARIAVEDLLYLSTAVSDNVASDALFDLVPPTEVNRTLSDIGVGGITIRHGMRELAETPAGRLTPDEPMLAQSLAIGSVTASGGHPIAQLDLSTANIGSARAFVDLLQELWVPTRVPVGVARAMRDLLGENVIRHRLAPDFSSDSSTWSSKTGTLLNLRHEIGVVEHADGDRLAVAALTRSSVPAASQPAAEALMARVARSLHDELRAS